MQAMLAQAWADLDLQEGESAMFVLDIPEMPNQSPPVVMVADAGRAARGTATTGRAMGVCYVVANVPETLTEYSAGTFPAQDLVYPWRDISLYFRVFENRTINNYAGNTYDLDTSSATIVRPPEHGKLVPAGRGEYLSYYYSPDAGYYGNDSAVIQGEVNGHKVKITYYFHSLDHQAYTYLKVCGKRGGYWKISLPTNGDTPALASILTTATQTLDFADLTGSAVGQTTGTAPTAQITLDLDAANHGWFIDYTPYLNDEYLPTSDPNVWIAREGSEAAGKMDMLSVLLHEYGHALGLEHSADAGDFMATTLQAGERRLPSASELELMAQLLGLAKETGSASSVPYNPFSPPSTPLPMTVSLAAFIADRQRRSSLSSALTQFEVAANPTLTNPQLADRQGWSTTGEVAIGAGAATLKETSTSQTRLNQAFVIGQNDRFLFFTLTGIALDDLNNVPDDAFM